jgi:hypothetical protein
MRSFKERVDYLSRKTDAFQTAINSILGNSRKIQQIVATPSTQYPKTAVGVRTYLALARRQHERAEKEVKKIAAEFEQSDRVLEYRKFYGTDEEEQNYTGEYRSQFKKCRNEGCIGFLGVNNVCRTCATVMCNNCFKIRNLPELTPAERIIPEQLLDESTAGEILNQRALEKMPVHVCDPTDVKNAELIKATTKECPVCYVSISKVEGTCTQTWCVNCHTLWYWDTGRIAKSNEIIHNPVYFQFMRSRNQGEQVDDRNLCNLRTIEQIATMGQRHRWLMDYNDRMRDLKYRVIPEITKAIRDEFPPHLKYLPIRREYIANTSNYAPEARMQAAVVAIRDMLKLENLGREVMEIFETYIAIYIDMAIAYVEDNQDANPVTKAVFMTNLRPLILDFNQRVSSLQLIYGMPVTTTLIPIFQ